LWKGGNKPTHGEPQLSPSARFGASEGNSPRAKQKGARDRLSAAFLTDFADDYEAHGKAVIETVRGQDPIAYMRIAAALLPTKVEVSEDPVTALSDEQLEAYRKEGARPDNARGGEGRPQSNRASSQARPAADAMSGPISKEFLKALADVFEESAERLFAMSATKIRRPMRPSSRRRFQRKSLTTSTPRRRWTGFAMRSARG